MSEFVVYSVPGSPYGRAVLATFGEKGAGYRFETVSGSRSEPHISRHPFGRVPALEHDGFMLYETQAIMRYLDRMLHGPALSPADPAAAARMDQVMNICDWYLFQGVNNVIGFHRIVAPRLFGSAPDEAAIAAAESACRVQRVVAAARDETLLHRRIGKSRRHSRRGSSRLPRPNARMGSAGADIAKPRLLAATHECTPKLQIDDVGTRCGARQSCLTRARKAQR
jgi:glutathione S-transferase